MKYLHCHVVTSECTGETTVEHRWETHDCRWERRRCLACGVVMETPEKEYQTVHNWAYEVAEKSHQEPDVDNESPLCECGEPTCMGTCYKGKDPSDEAASIPRPKENQGQQSGVFDELIAALQEIGRLAAKDGTFLFYPELVKQSEADLDGFQKQPCDSELFEYEYCSQNGGGITGDSFQGDMMYPIRDWFIKVHYNC
ncbi:MAG: hypothetical protein LLF76_02940 [Planctomycetaceae bacterium]|nr:hypothetical protein [Planctomycetaceae bacterium]